MKYYIALLLCVTITSFSFAQASKNFSSVEKDEMTVEFTRSSNTIRTNLQVAKASVPSDSPREILYTVTIVDPQGFTHDQPMTKKPLAPGTHTLDISTESWKVGSYQILLYRNGDMVATKSVTIAPNR